MKLHSNSHLRRASSFPMFVLLLLLLVVSTCQASPVPAAAAAAAEQKEAEKPNAEPAATAVGKPQSEVVVVAAAVEAADDAEGDGGTKSDSLEAASARDEAENVGEELTQGAIVSGDLDLNDDDVAQAASFFVQRMAMEPRLLRRASSDASEVEGEEDDDVDEVDDTIIMNSQSRVGEIGTIISVIKIATELGEAVLPVVIKEVQASPIGNLVIGVIGGINDGASGAAGESISPGSGIPIKVARRAVRGFLKAHMIGV